VGRPIATVTPITADQRAGRLRDRLQLDNTVMPIRGSSMRLLEAAIAIAAIATAVLLGLVR
jgi:hypothetical protein